MTLTKLLLTWGLLFSLAQPMMIYAQNDTSETTEEVTPSIYETKITSYVKAGQATSTQNQPATIAYKQAQKGVEVVDVIRYEGLIPEEKYEISCQLVYYEGYQTKVVTETFVTKKASDTGSGKWNISLGEINGLKTGVKYHMFEEVVSENAFTFQEGIQKQTYTQQDPYSNLGMIKVAEVNEMAPASKEITFHGNTSLENPLYVLVQYVDNVEQSIEMWEDTEAHTYVLSEGSYALVEYQDSSDRTNPTFLYFHLANDGTIEVRQDNKWVSSLESDISMNGIMETKKEEKEKVQEKKEETKKNTSFMIPILVVLIVILVVLIKILAFRILRSRYE